MSSKKYFILLIGLTCVCINSKAQPILDFANTGIAVGETYNLDMISWLDPGASGANVTWDFSNTNILKTELFDFIAPSSTTNGSLVPYATVCNSKPGGVLNYYKTDVNLHELVAVGTQGGYFELFSDPKKYLSFPFTYAQSFTDTFRSNFISSFTPYIRTGTIQVEADAYGIMTTPYGTYSDVLRLKIYEEFYDTFEQGPNAQDTAAWYLFMTYQWYSPGNHYPVFSLNFYTTSFAATARYGYVQNNPITSPSTSIDAPYVFDIIPNPIHENSMAFLNGHLPESAVYSVYDALGKNVNIGGSSKLSFMENNRINIQGLNPGIYFIKVFNEHFCQIKKLLIY